MDNLSNAYDLLVRLSNEYNIPIGQNDKRNTKKHKNTYKLTMLPDKQSENLPDALSNDYNIWDKLSNYCDILDKLYNDYNLLDTLSNDYNIATGQNVK